MKKALLAALVLVGGVFAAHAQQPVGVEITKPLSAEDKAMVESLLKDFDPRTYAFKFNYKDKDGTVKTSQVGNAKGLGSVKLSNTKIIKPGGTVASTVNKNNIFAASTVNKNNIFVASTVNKNNIFVAATVNQNNIFVAATVNQNNIFKPSPNQLSKMDQLHAILSKY